MKLSEITVESVREYLRLELDVDIATLPILIDSAKNYIRSYTGKTDEELDKFDEISIAMMILVSEFYDNRRYLQDRNYSNKAVDMILDMHSVNLL